MEYRPFSIPDIRNATIQDLYQLAKNDGRLGYSASKGLYTTTKPTSDALQHAFRHLVDVPTGKRQAVLVALKGICDANNMKFGEALKNSRLPVETQYLVIRAQVDFTTEYLHAMLRNCVQINKTWFVIEKRLGKGGFATVDYARHGSVKVALKRGLQPETTDQEPTDSVANDMAREGDLLELSSRKKVYEKSHVAETYGTGEDLKRRKYLVMGVAEGDAGEVVDIQGKLGRIQEEFGSRGRQTLTASKREELYLSKTPLTQKFLTSSARKPALILTVRDWTDAVQQIASAGIAHRDIKADNFLLTDDGNWVLTDFGTSGHEHDLFSPTPGKKPYQLTGNEIIFAKSPEWVKSEDAAKTKGPPFQVGLKDDVFSLGVAAYRLLTGGRFPFDGLPQQPDASIAEFAYIDNMRAYVASEMPFSQWHEGHTGRTIPEKWTRLLDGALDSDPERRRSAEQLRALELFQDPKLDDPKVRKAILKQFKS